MPLKHNQANLTDQQVQTPFEANSYLARVVQVIDLGKQTQTDWQTKEEKEPKYEVMITFEFPEVRNEEDKPSWLSKRFTFPQSYPAKLGIRDNTNLFKFFSTFLPEKLVQAVRSPNYYFIEDSAWDALLNMSVFCEVVLNSTGKPKIKTIMNVPSFAGEVPPLENEPLVFEATSATADQWKQIYLWVRNIILTSLDEETAAAAKVLEEQTKIDSPINEDGDF